MAGEWSMLGNCSRLLQYNRLSSPIPAAGKTGCVPIDAGWNADNVCSEVGRESTHDVGWTRRSAPEPLSDRPPHVDMIESMLNPLARLRVVSTGIIVTLLVTVLNSSASSNPSVQYLSRCLLSSRSNDTIDHGDQHSHRVITKQTAAAAVIDNHKLAAGWFVHGLQHAVVQLIN